MSYVIIQNCISDLWLYLCMLNSEFIRITDWVGHVSVFIVSGAYDLF